MGLVWPIDPKLGRTQSPKSKLPDGQNGQAVGAHGGRQQHDILNRSNEIGRPTSFVADYSGEV